MVEEMNYEEKCSMVSHYVGHYLCLLSAQIEKGELDAIEERRQRLIGQLKSFGDHDLAIKVIKLVEEGDFSNITGEDSFRKAYGKANPREGEFDRKLSEIKKQFGR